MAALAEINQVGKREDLRDMITIVDAKNKPFLAMVPKIKKATNMLMQWQVDDHDSLDTGGVADTKDVDTFENAAKNRALVQNYCQKKWRTAMVGDIAQNVSNVAGASSELARSLDMKTEQLSRDIEAVLCGSQGAQAETDVNTPYITRGLGQWISGTYTGINDTQVPAAARPPSGSVTTDMASGLTEAELRAVLKSQFVEYGNRNDLDMFAGVDVKEDITDFTQTSSGSTNTQIAVRSFNAPQGNKITHNVTIYEGDYNTVKVHPSLLLGATTGDSAGSATTCYILPLDKYGLAFNRAPRVRQLEDQGGGPRAVIDAIFGLVSWSPRSSAKITAS